MPLHRDSHDQLGRTILKLQDSLKKAEKPPIGMNWLADWQQSWEQRRGAIYRRLDIIEANLERLVDLEHGTGMPSFSLVGVPDDNDLMGSMGPL